MRQFNFFIFLLVLYSEIGYSQKNNNAEGFHLEKLPILLHSEINLIRAQKGLDTLENLPMLKSAAEMSSTDMAEEGSEKTDEATSIKYLEEIGATKQGKELTVKMPTAKGKEDLSTLEVCKQITAKWMSNEKFAAILMDPNFRLCGIAAAMDEEGEKVFVSAFFGGYNIANDGVLHKKLLPVPYNTASKKLLAGDVRSCKTCDQWRNYNDLYNGLYVTDGKIMLRYSNAKDLKRLLKKPTDGLAVDVVQKTQYMSAYYNITDNNLLNKGIMGKVLLKDKIFKKNLLLTKDKKANSKIKGLEIMLGKINPKITGAYELNLLIIQDGKVCRTVTRGYNENFNIESSTPIGLLPMPVTKGPSSPFEPRSESSILNFTIPFQKNKSEFLQQDVEPFIKALNEPDFIIDGLYIYAYSSIEGDSVANAKLQRNRAESVVNILQKQQKNKINTTILNRDSWGLFLLENEDGKFGDVVALGKKKAINKINGDKQLLEELEPILSKERFAQVILDVTYDISGDKEKRFAIHSFNKSARSGNIKQSQKILDFISKRIRENRYAVDVLDSLSIPQNEKAVALLNNKIYHKFLLTSAITEQDAAAISDLQKLSPLDPVLQYNNIFCKLKFDSAAGDPLHQKEVQATIDELYKKLDTSLVNGLNIEWQFRMMSSLDTLPDSDLLTEQCINRIKTFYNIKDATWQNAVKLSQVYVRAKDFKNAATILEPYLNKPKVSEQLLFTYISIASRLPEKYHSRIFASALAQAKEKNPERYCSLFGAPYMTFQVLENPEVKRTYQLSCGH